MCQFARAPKGKLLHWKKQARVSIQLQDIRMTAAGEKTAENFFLVGKYREQKTGIFKGKRAGEILRERNSPTARG